MKMICFQLESILRIGKSVLHSFVSTGHELYLKHLMYTDLKLKVTELKMYGYIFNWRYGLELDEAHLNLALASLQKWKCPFSKRSELAAQSMLHKSDQLT